MINKSILLVLPSVDFNEQEYLIIYNSLIKNGYKVFIASDANAVCVGQNGLKVKNDVSFFNMREANFTALVLIGGKGVKLYWDNSQVHALARNFLKAKKIVSAICSAPVILARAGILNGINAVCFPDDKREIEREGAIFTDSPSVISKKIITGQGPSYANEFVNSLINELGKL